MNDIKPCPFCGHEDGENGSWLGYYADDQGYFFWCQECGIAAPRGRTPLEAGQNWNRLMTSAQMADHLGAIAELVGESEDPGAAWEAVNALRERAERAEAERDAIAKLAPDVLAYAVMMQHKLDANSHKDGWPEYDDQGRRTWKEVHTPFLIGKLWEEMNELVGEFGPGKEEAFVKEAADVGNIAMMLAAQRGLYQCALPPAPDEAEPR